MSNVERKIQYLLDTYSARELATLLNESYSSERETHDRAEQAEGRVAELEKAIMDISCCRSDDEAYFVDQAIKAARSKFSKTSSLSNQADSLEKETPTQQEGK